MVTCTLRGAHKKHEGVQVDPGKPWVRTFPQWPNEDYVAPSAPSSKPAQIERINDLVERTRTAVPVKSYAGTSGWSGSETSRDRALDQDASGITAASQWAVLRLVSEAGVTGVTVAEIRQPHTDMHHGMASGALTNLHKGGHITRLTDKRGKCQVYVLPEHVNGRTEASL